MPHDVINRLVLEIDLESDENQAKTESDILFEQYVRLALDRVWARYGHVDAIFPDTVEIDLGSVDKTDLVYKLENSLSLLIEQHVNNPRHTASNNTSKTNDLSMASTFLDYLHRPIIPWDIDDVAAFDRATLVKIAIDEVVRSDNSFEQLLSMISRDLATCRRFFDIAFEHTLFPDVVAQITTSKTHKQESRILAELIRMLWECTKVNPEIFRDISYYIISGVLFTNQHNSNDAILLAIALIMEFGAVQKTDILNLLINNTSKSEQSLPVSKENKSKLDDSIDNKSNVSDFFVSNEYISFANNKTDEQHPCSNNSIHNDTSILLSTKKRDYNASQTSKLTEIKNLVDEQHPYTNNTIHDDTSILLNTKESDYNASQTSKLTEIENLDESVDTSEWHEATMLITLLNKISLSPQIVVSDIEQAERALSSLMTKINRLHTKDTAINNNTISNLKTKSGRLNIKDIVEIVIAIGNTDSEQPRQVDDRIQYLNQKIINIIGTQPLLTERIPLYNAGLVLYNPFLISFFDHLKLLENRRRFRSLEHQFRAVHLLHELSGMGEAHFEHLLPLNKLLCGVNMSFPVGEKFSPTERERDEIERLSKALISNWTIIKNSSVAGFQESFVRRRGVLERSDKDWILRVETKGIDVLLDDIPWNIHLISLPWNDYLIHVDWKL